VLERVRRTDFPIAFRGYDRAAVDAYVADIAELVAELEATTSREAVVERALEQVGEETTEILKRAHETAAEVTARARAQAEGRLQRAETEADELRREAEDQVRRVHADAGAIWEERSHLIEDMRALAEELLAVADNALERMPVPEAREPLSGGPSPAGREPWFPPDDEPTVEAPETGEIETDESDPASDSRS
jgi:cell division initiation protein